MTERHAEIDALKAAGVVTIVFIHAIRSPWDPGVSAAEVWLGHVTRFGVPAFLLASGFLYATRERVGAATTLRRLRRLAVPYGVASLAAFVLFGDRPGTGSTGSLWLDLLTGSALGPYYYVVVIAGLVVVTPLLARLSPTGLAVTTLGFVAVQWAVDAATLWLLPLEWHLRSPLLWWGYFLAGWWLRLDGGAALAAARDAPAGATALLGVAAVGLAGLAGLEGEAPRLVVRSAAWALVWVLLALLWRLASGRTASPALRWLSDASYPVYLFHLFAVFPVRDVFPGAQGALDPMAVALPWVAGLAAPVAGIAALQRLLGPRSRDWIGA